MEMEKVPAAGYRIVGLPVAGFHRRLTFKNITFFYKLWTSLIKARRILEEFRPDVVVGVGGYASGPVLRRATGMGIPCLIQEQNSFPGVTNCILAGKVQRICVAYAGMERFFPAKKIVFTGNPVRQDLMATVDRAEAAAFFGIDPAKPVVLVIGGSLGARSINEGIAATLTALPSEVQLLWQTGKLYYPSIQRQLETLNTSHVHAFDFIYRMDYAFALADVVISRAGASSISELAVLGKPALFVPSPNVSEDHQTKNAKAMADARAARMVADTDTHTLLAECVKLLADRPALRQLAEQIKTFAKPHAATEIAKQIMDLAKQHEGI